jgi:DNA replication protein DnaC
VWLERWIPIKVYHPKVDELRSACYEFTRGYAASPALGKLLVIYGGSGNGKTTVARCVHRWASRIGINLPLVLTGHATQTKTPDSFFCHWPTIVDNFKKGDWDIDDAFSHCLTVIDDIGAEHDPSTIGRQKLYSLLEHRVRKWTIVTTNYGPAVWENKFETRIADRLFRNATHIDMSEVPSYSATQL